LPPKQRSHPAFISRLCFAGAFTVVLLGSLVSFGAVGYARPALARAVDAVTTLATQRGQQRPKVVGDSPARDQYGPKRTKICHKGHTIIVDESAVPAHLRHGDQIGGCPSAAGVLGAGNKRSSGNGRRSEAPADTPGSGTLASTGFALGTTAVLGGVLVAFGLAFRRKAL
jgi:hypothetical protein